MRVPLEDEKAIEREKIAAYAVGHLPIVKAYVRNMLAFIRGNRHFPGCILKLRKIG
jgi:hypothetical protein